MASGDEDANMNGDRCDAYGMPAAYLSYLRDSMKLQASFLTVFDEQPDLRSLERRSSKLVLHRLFLILNTLMNSRYEPQVRESG